MRRKVTRRDFMKGAAIVAASGLLAGCSGGEGPAAPDNSEQPGTSEKPAESNSNSSSSSESESTSSSKPEETNEIKWTYSKNSDGTITLKGYDKNAEKVPSGELIIPEKYDGKVGATFSFPLSYFRTLDGNDQETQAHLIFNMENASYQQFDIDEDTMAEIEADVLRDIDQKRAVNEAAEEDERPMFQ